MTARKRGVDENKTRVRTVELDPVVITAPQVDPASLAGQLDTQEAVLSRLRAAQSERTASQSDSEAIRRAALHRDALLNRPSFVSGGEAQPSTQSQMEVQHERAWSGRPSETRLPAAGVGALSGSALGWVDEFAGGVDLPIPIGEVRSVPVPGIGTLARLASGIPSSATRAQARDATRRLIEEHQRREPRSFAAGQVASQLPMMAIPGGGTTALGRMALATGTGAGLGAVQGAGDAPELRDVPRAALSGAETGAVTSGVLSGASEAAVPLLARLGQRLRLPAARQRIAAAGIQRATERNRLPGAAGDINDLDLLEPGEHPLVEFADTLRETGISGGPLRSVRSAGERGAQVRREANEALGGLFDEARSAAAEHPLPPLPGERPAPGEVDAGRLASRIDDIAQSVEGVDPASLAVQREIRNIAQSIRDAANARGGVPMSVVNATRRSLGQARNYAPGAMYGNVGPASRRATYSAVRESMGEGMQRMRPGSEQELAREMERNFAGRLASEGAERVASAAHGNRVISPTDYASMMIGATGVGGAALMHNPVAGGAAIGGALALNRLIRPREHAIAASTLEWLSGGLRALGSPQAQNWSRMLTTAASRSPAAARLMHQTLLRREPEYRAAIQQIESQQAQPQGAEPTDTFDFQPEPESEGFDFVPEEQE